MRKTVWKLAPYEPFEVDAIAGWLDEMSQNRLQFQSKWGPFCRFERSPSPARYRVDPRRSEFDPTEEERTETYRHFGWEFCSYYTRYAEVYRAEDPSAPELHTDSDLLDGLVKRTIRNRLLLCLLLGINLWWFILRDIPDVFVWYAESFEAIYLSLLLAQTTFTLAVILTIGQTLVAWLKYRKQGRIAIHTAQRARRWLFWRGLWLGLVVLFVVTYLWALLAYITNS